MRRSPFYHCCVASSRSGIAEVAAQRRCLVSAGLGPAFDCTVFCQRSPAATPTQPALARTALAAEHSDRMKPGSGHRTEAWRVLARACGGALHWRGWVVSLGVRVRVCVRACPCAVRVLSRGPVAYVKQEPGAVRPSMPPRPNGRGGCCLACTFLRTLHACAHSPCALAYATPPCALAPFSQHLLAPQPLRLPRPARETCVGWRWGGRLVRLVVLVCVPLAAVVVVPVGVWAALCPVCGVWP